MMTNKQVQRSIKNLVASALNAAKSSEKYKKVGYKTMEEWSDGRRSGFLQAAKFLAQDLKMAKIYR